MSNVYSLQDFAIALKHASQCLSERKEEINRLNVFPVPDGDTGTNMSLTIESVVEAVSSLGSIDDAEVFGKTIINGALMGARGNSGVITSQILRGFCEGSQGIEIADVRALEQVFAKAQEIAFQAVRKPVEGTILTVLRDSAEAARYARKKKMEFEDALDFIVKESFSSVSRTPDYLPVLKENGVVDAGGFGLAIFLEGFAAAFVGKEESYSQFFSASTTETAKVEIEQINDWDQSEFRYCTEFLVHSDTLNEEKAKKFLQKMGDCDLMVGFHPNFKVHVHSNRPDEVLGWFLSRDAQVSEVHIHNMHLQSAERERKIGEGVQASVQEEALKPYGIVAVCSGDGCEKILESLGVDVIVSGGQTMNPSTRDLVDAAQKISSEAVLFLPNNSNIIMAAQSACSVLDRPAAVVPTKSLPDAFGALFSFDEEQDLETNVETMTEAFADIKTLEVTRAVKPSKDAHNNPIAEGDYIGILSDSIEIVSDSLEDACMRLLEVAEADEADMLTVLAGADLKDEEYEALRQKIEDVYFDVEVDFQRGDQPLYPLIMSLE